MMQDDDRPALLIVAASEGAAPWSWLPGADAATGLLLDERIASALPHALSGAGWAFVRRWSSLVVGGSVSAPHRLGCACCQGRSPLALLLSELFLQRARGQLPFFHGLLLPVPADEVLATGDLLLGDRLVAGRYRVQGRPGQPN